LRKGNRKRGGEGGEEVAKGVDSDDGGDQNVEHLAESYPAEPFGLSGERGFRILSSKRKGKKPPIPSTTFR